MKAFISVLLLTAVTALAQESRTAPLGPITVSSPDGALAAIVAGTGQAGGATWRYRLDQQSAPRQNALAPRTELVGWSPLGIVRDDETFATLRLKGVSPVRTVTERYTMPHGKQREVTKEFSERVLHFESPSGKPLDLVVRVANDGLAFRYRFPDHSTTEHRVKEELTGFTVANGSHGWLLPHQKAGKWSPAYEDFFSEVDAGTTAPNPAGWSYPALFRLPDAGHWLLITEAGLDPTYCGTRLRAEAPGGTYRVRFPDAEEGLGTGSVEPASTLPWATPWRVIIAGDSLVPIVESTLVTDLSAPSVIGDASWVRPGRGSDGWWKDDDASKKEDVLDRFIDLASEMTWEYSLLDANWHLLPDGALDRVLQHAKAKNVGIQLWYNSGGPNNEITEWGPRDRLFDPEKRRAEFARIAALGVKGVKVDFWQSDKQNVIGAYYDTMKDAAAARLLIDVDGSTIPRGWSRTFPNLVSMEAVFGSEQYKYDARMSERGAWHNTVLPFTRNVIGPMDYNPVTFSDAKYPHQTTNAHELALSVVFESATQHFVDGPEAYGALPDAAKQFLKDVPTAWDETRLVAGAPGDLAVVARRNAATWWVGGISGTSAARTVPVDLSFLEDGEFDVIIVRDGAVPRQMVTESATMRAVDRINIPLLARGGFALRFTKK
jgi:alpha-glucosidase